jgi:DNA-binding transcriptional regulator GbsR (MarR family)
MNQDEIEYIEATGRAFDVMGMPRIAGRIIGWLLLCEPAHQTLDELCAATGSSKASASTMVRLLVNLQLAERTSQPGDRRDYVQLQTGAFERLLAQQTRELETLRDLADRGLQLMKGASTARRERLRRMRSLYLFLEKELPPLLDRWDKQDRAHRARGGDK